MFDLSEDLIIQEELFLDSKIYSIDNFYKNPKEVHDYLLVVMHHFIKFMKFLHGIMFILKIGE